MTRKLKPGNQIFRPVLQRLRIDGSVRPAKLDGEPKMLSAHFAEDQAAEVFLFCKRHQLRISELIRLAVLTFIDKEDET
jgi:hypothetical protein